MAENRVDCRQIKINITSFENNNIGCGIFLDISKAFDAMDHSILLCIPVKYGIRGITLKWLKGYLSERYQYVSRDTSFPLVKKLNVEFLKDSY